MQCGIKTLYKVKGELPAYTIQNYIIQDFKYD